MGFGRMKTDAEMEYEAKYCGKTDTEMNEIVGGMIREKFSGIRAGAVQKRIEREAKYTLPYAELVKAVAKTGKQVETLEGKPESLLNEKRKALEVEYADLVMRGKPDINKELWIGERLVEYMRELGGEYREAKNQLQQARNDYAIYLAKKEEWEQENADIIEAERIRTKRAELMQADPETLRALGIAPDPTYIATTQNEVVGNIDMRKALKAIHPSATEMELDSMLKLV